MRFIKKILLGVLILLLLFILWAFLTLSIRYFRKAWLKSTNTVTLSGTKYAHLASEPNLYYLGGLEFETNIDGEPESFSHMLGTIKTGLFSIKDAEIDNILIRYHPDDEWFSIYRKSSLPPLDYSADNCCRIEFVDANHASAESEDHRSCGKGVTDPSMIIKFLSDVRSQKTPAEAGLYDYVIQTNGFFKNCYIAGAIYGYFEAEPYVHIRMDITSYNDQAYSISIEGKDYVLPEKWVELLGVH